MENGNVISQVQKMLFRYPVLDWVNKNDGNIYILVVGDTEYAETFADLCMQVGQIWKHDLVINWCVSNDQTKKKYLTKRPGLASFVSIDHNNLNDDEQYAYLNFRDTDMYLDDGILAVSGYVFIDKDDDTENEDIAALYRKMTENPCLVQYVREGSIIVDYENSYADETYSIKQKNSLLTSETELERMAFNTHWIWEGKGNLDMPAVKRRFSAAYNFNSSVSFVLSIPYKLRSIGISENDPYIAADLVKEHLEGKNNIDSSDPDIGILSVLEHRRWVMEKVTQGAVRLSDQNDKSELYSCIERKSVKKMDSDGNLLMHPCIVRATPDFPLSNGKFKDHRLWDNPKVRLTGLDELDRTSVELHRIMLKEANRIRANKEEIIQLLNCLHSICISYDELIIRNFDRYYFCIENILDRSRPYTSQFETYERMLKNSLYGMSDTDQKNALFYMNKIRYTLFPVIESNQYRDYKNNNTELIKQIPYILTAKSHVHLCLPLGETNRNKNNNSDYFRCVASATALYAETIDYLYILNESSDLQILESKLKAVSNYFYYRGNDCRINLFAFCGSNSLPEEKRKKLSDLLNKAQNSRRLQTYRIIESGNSDEQAARILDVIRSGNADYYDGSIPLLSSNIHNGVLYSEISKVIPYFEFDDYNRQFRNCIHCEYLEYAELSSFIQVEDMFALLNANDIEFNYQDYADLYKVLWNIYSGQTLGESDFALCARSWTRLSNILQSGGIECLNIQNCDIQTNDPNEIRVVRKMLAELQRAGILTHLKITGQDKISCVLRDTKAKALFSKAGDILEIYVYFEACRTEWFDDVQTGYKFKWEFDNIVNELDCVLTKGFRSILVECKSTKDPDENFYLTLDSLADHFGIGYKKVLVLVTDTASKTYELYRSRGRQMNIITLSSKSDLDEIGNRLIEIMNSPE